MQWNFPMVWWRGPEATSQGFPLYFYLLCTGKFKSLLSVPQDFLVCAAIPGDHRLRSMIEKQEIIW